MTDFRAPCPNILRELDYAALCAELVNELHGYKVAHPNHDTEVIDRARAALAEPGPERPTDEELAEFLQQLTYKEMSESSPFGAPRWDPDKEHQRELSRVRAALARWGNPEPAPPADTHYEWELEDAHGEWQAGGSSNSQADVEREGMRYLQGYAQDGAHKLIIRQHTTQIINEITND